MNIFNEIKIKFIYIYRMIKIICQNDKVFLIYILFDIILSSINPFILMYLIKISINMLILKEQFLIYITKIITLLLSMLIINLLQNFVSTKSGILGNLIGNKLFKNIFNKTTQLDYEMLLNKTVLEKRELAMQVIEGGRFNNLSVNVKSFLSCIIILSGVIVVVSSIDIWILLVVIAIVIINSISTTIRKKTERMVSVESVPINRKISYFWDINTDFEYGKEIRLYNMQYSINTRYNELLNSLQSFVSKIFNLQAKGSYLNQCSTFVLDILIYIYLGYKVIILNTITVGDFSLYINAIRTFNIYIQSLVSSFIDISNNGLYLKDYFDFLQIESKFEKNSNKFINNESGSFNLKLENIYFKYPNQDNFTLKDINLNINFKEKISIVGENGAGKTTLIKLLMRLYEPTKGRILLNGIDIKEICYKEYISFFSTVFQDFKLLSFTIRDNLTSLNNLNSQEETIFECLNKVGLYNKIKKLNKGLDTYLNKVYEEEGIELSGGEGQKLAIARALIKNSPIIILDEPTAALDPQAEYDIYSQFKNMVHGKTAIFISHRLSSTRFCDKVIVLKDGEIVELGTHNELINNNSYYATLYKLQSQYYIDTEEKISNE